MEQDIRIREELSKMTVTTKSGVQTIVDAKTIYTETFVKDENGNDKLIRRDCHVQIMTPIQR